VEGHGPEVLRSCAAEKFTAAGAAMVEDGTCAEGPYCAESVSAIDCVAVAESGRIAPAITRADALCCSRRMADARALLIIPCAVMLQGKLWRNFRRITLS
jgi:hypothetical protein